MKIEEFIQESLAYLMSLDEDKDEFLLKQNEWLKKDQLEQLKKLDPTNGKYLVWLVKLYKNNKKILNDENIPEYLKLYNKIKNKLDQKDKNIMNLNLYQLAKLLNDYDNYPDLFLSNKELKEKAFFKSIGNWNIYKTTSYQQNKALASNTSWCTAGSDEGQTNFDDYIKKGDLYIFINKKNSEDKYQLCVNKNGIIKEFTDAKNIKMDLDPLIKDKDDLEIFNVIKISDERLNYLKKKFDKLILIEKVKNELEKEIENFTAEQIFNKLNIIYQQENIFVIEVKNIIELFILTKYKEILLNPNGFINSNENLNLSTKTYIIIEKQENKIKCLYEILEINYISFIFENKFKAFHNINDLDNKIVEFNNINSTIIADLILNYPISNNKILFEILQDKNLRKKVKIEINEILNKPIKILPAGWTDKYFMYKLDNEKQLETLASAINDNRLYRNIKFENNMFAILFYDQQSKTENPKEIYVLEIKDGELINSYEAKGFHVDLTHLTIQHIELKKLLYLAKNYKD